MVIINLRFGHENSIFSLNNFILVTFRIMLLLFLMFLFFASFISFATFIVGACCFVAFCVNARAPILIITSSKPGMKTKWKQRYRRVIRIRAWKQTPTTSRKIWSVNSILWFALNNGPKKKLGKENKNEATTTAHSNRFATHPRHSIRLWWRMFLHNLFDCAHAQTRVLHTIRRLFTRRTPKTDSRKWWECNEESPQRRMSSRGREMDAEEGQNECMKIV